jgi:hypothetical protein
MHKKEAIQTLVTLRIPEKRKALRMESKKTQTDTSGMEKIIAEAKRDREIREKTYRERALKLFPHVCAKCSREFEGRKLKELTVHHRDHNHENNPPDGSNWELLCIYCHDNEHSRDLDSQWYAKGGSGNNEPAPSSGNNPFEGLDALLKRKI